MNITGKNEYVIDDSVTDKVDKISLWLEDHKGRDINSVNMSRQGNFCDFMIIATANSMRHAQSLTSGLIEFCHENGYDFLHLEGYDSAQWILVDLNDILVHIFLEEVRGIYRLESLWCGL